MEFCNYVYPSDIARRILYRKRFWFHGPPQIMLEGEEGNFGMLKLDFGDEIITWSILIQSRDKILNAVHYAVCNFQEIIMEMQSEE